MKTIPDEPALLDSIDRRILAELQDDGRMTNVELARRAGISAPPCLRRVRRLEEAGIIRGYHADTDPQTLGWEITFFAIVGLESQKELVLSAFESLVAGWPEVPVVADAATGRAAGLTCVACWSPPVPVVHWVGPCLSHAGG